MHYRGMFCRCWRYKLFSSDCGMSNSSRSFHDMLTNDGDVTRNEADESFASEVSDNEDIVSIAKSLVGTPIYSLLREPFIKSIEPCFTHALTALGIVTMNLVQFLKIGKYSENYELVTEFIISHSGMRVVVQMDDIQLLRSLTATEAEGGGDTLRRKWQLFYDAYASQFERICQVEADYGLLLSCQSCVIPRNAK
ncbi:hypothetical protein KXD40_006630 [Peronospora effusa]|uniref:Uncharacterized protein n=1 Tax=Peronospora effusa TaxID=542832 RepID=A0A3M6VBH4_9STRA|nr:hypothetical protein DD238_004185 [Peronospora effusa]RQM17583.1 hypothetical protein DD237_003117 [Peronospora effusa]UIZ24968.1 hypothetical protein KXD40_006630 [Peronospora effusa]